MARRPCPCSSREKFSGTSPSEHTSPALFTYQNRPSTPVEVRGYTVTQLWNIWGLKLNGRLDCGQKDSILDQNAYKLTFDVVGAITELQSKDVIDGSVGVQCVGVPMVADESMLPSQNQHGSVDQLQTQQIILT